MKRPPLSERFTISGLTKEGKILSLTKCPFLEVCGSVNNRCPTMLMNYNNDFSCSYSRAFAISNYYNLFKENK